MTYDSFVRQFRSLFLRGDTRNAERLRRWFVKRYPQTIEALCNQAIHDLKNPRRAA